MAAADRGEDEVGSPLKNEEEDVVGFVIINLCQEINLGKSQFQLETRRSATASQQEERCGGKCWRKSKMENFEKKKKNDFLA